jgi:integrase
VGPGTIGKEVRILRAALRWAVAEKWISHAPNVESPPKPAPRERFLSREEADALVQACGAPHLRLFVILALNTAARRGAILDLRWDQVDLDKRIIHFRRPGRAETKKRRATVPINTTALAALQEAALLAVTDHVIEWNGKPVHSIRHSFENAVKRAGIAYCTRHDLRRTAASWMMMARVPVEEIAAMLGDTPEMVRKVYGRFDPSYLSNAARALEGDTSPRIVIQEEGVA